MPWGFYADGGGECHFAITGENKSAINIRRPLEMKKEKNRCGFVLCG